MHLEFPIRPERLTPAEQRVLEYIEGNREEFLFMTIGQLAAKMGLSEATISRFARHLGCQDFKQLKNIVIEQNHLEGPAGKLAGTLFTGNGEEPFQAAEYLKKQMLYLEKNHAESGTAGNRYTYSYRRKESSFTPKAPRRPWDSSFSSGCAAGDCRSHRSPPAERR